MRSLAAVIALGALLLGGPVLFPGKAVGAPRVPGLKPGELAVRVYDVGQGQCILIECPDDPPILNDCGKKGRGGHPIEAGASLAKRLTMYRGIYGPAFLRVLISHPHEDHYSLLAPGKYGFQASDVDVLYFGGDFAKFLTAREWINSLSLSRTGHEFDGVCGASVGVTCLAPNQSAFPWAALHCGTAEIDLLTVNAFSHHKASGRKLLSDSGGKLKGSNPNGDSAMLRIRYAGASVILPGDAEQVSQFYATRNAADAGLPLGGTSVLVVPHHGSTEFGSNDPDWVEATSPATVVISSNRGGGYGHPYCEALENFDSARYADGDEMVRARAPMTVSCGLNKTTIVEREVVHQFVLTETVGDVTLRMLPTGLRLECQTGNAACAAASAR